MSSEPALLPAISSGFESLERGKGGRRKEGRGGVGGEGWEEKNRREQREHVEGEYKSTN